MRHARYRTLLGALTGVALLAGALTPAAQAGFGVTESNFEAGTCVSNTPECTYGSPKAQFYTQAAGHPPIGLTAFEVNSEPGLLPGSKAPVGNVKNIRVDVPPGLAANPEALPKCSVASFEANTCPANTQVGENHLVAYLAGLDTPPITAPVYNLDQPGGVPLEFGIYVAAVGPITKEQHIFLVGHVSWNTDYHEYFEINNVSSEVPLLKSTLLFNGRAGNGNFLTLPSVCSPSTTSHLRVESYTDQVSETFTHTPVGVEGCDKVPFKPTAAISTETAASDQPDGVTTVVKVPQNAGAGEINTADIRDAHVTLPEGMTLDPSAAHGLEACTQAQAALNEVAPGVRPSGPVTCPPASKVGTVTIETDLPAKTLSGNVYLGSPAGGPIAGPPYTIYLDAESSLGVSVRLQGTVTPNPSTGRLEATFTNNPQLTFSELILSLNGGARAPLANPLVCGSAPVESLFTPYTGGAPALSSSPFLTSGCPNPVPFALSQSTKSANATAGAYSPYTFNLSRADGQQYLSQVATTLPAGLLGAVPSVPLCGEPQAAQGRCSAVTQIGTATVTAGAGPEPYPLSGPVFLTGPYDGAPYGLSIPVAVLIGGPPTPTFNLGTVVTRAKITVDPHTARVSVSSPPAGTAGALPSIVGGVPVRLKSLSVAVNRPNFIFNPTNCAPLHTESTLTSVFKATQILASPFQVGNCSALPFTPSFKVSTSAKTSKKTGASLQVSLIQGAHQANMQSVFVSLPKQLPSRLTTLQKACPEATFAANPVSCRTLGSEVGTATVVTPVLPGQLQGSAYLVSHGGAAFPDLDVVLEGDGVKVILTGNTNIKAGITTSTFATIPDVPVTSFVLDLPVGPHSALTAIGSLCLKPLVIPTTITAQSGAQVKQNTRISVSGCGVRILSHRVLGHTLILKVRTLGGGRLTAKGKGLSSASRRVRKSSTVIFKLPLTRGGLKELSKAHRSHRRLKTSVHVAFAPQQNGAPLSAAAATITFKR